MPAQPGALVAARLVPASGPDARRAAGDQEPSGAGDNSDGVRRPGATMTPMTFEDLPPGASQIPLTDARVAGDVIDLIIGDSDRAAGCVGLMLCDEEHRGVQPVVLHDVADDRHADGLVSLLGLVLPLLAQSHGSILVARGRARGTVVDDVDRAWHQAAIQLCATHGVRLLGFHVATRDGVFRLPEPLTAAS